MDTLPAVLDGLESQKKAPAFELIVVDDGSNDGTLEFLNNRKFQFKSLILTQSNKGPAAARNKGVKHARGRRVAFIGEDTIPAPDWLAQHEAAWKDRGSRTNLGVLGHIQWPPDTRQTPFRSFFDRHTSHFGFDLIDNPENVPFCFFYTSNCSLDRARLVEEPFDERFRYPAWEDIELSYRLGARDGKVREDGNHFQIIYTKNALVTHDHAMTLTATLKRTEITGLAGATLFSIHPELDSFLSFDAKKSVNFQKVKPGWLWESLAYHTEGFPVLRFPKTWVKLLNYHYLRGLHKGLETLKNSRK